MLLTNKVGRNPHYNEREEMSKLIIGKGGVVIAETRELVVCENCGKETEPEDLNYMNWHCPYCHEKIAD